MSAIKTLVLMQLFEKLNLKGRLLKGKYLLFRIVLALLKYALIIVLCYALMYVCKIFNVFSLIKFVPVSVVSIVFLVMFVLQTLAVTWNLTKSLYYSKDNPILLVMPCKSIHVYLSKLILFYIFEYIRNLSFIIPMFIAYGILNHLSLIYYPWLLFVFLFISMVPVLIGAILSIPTMMFYNIFRQYKTIQLIVLAVLLLLITILIFYLIGLIPNDIDFVKEWQKISSDIQEFLRQYMVSFSVVYQMTLMITGEVNTYQTIPFDMNTLYMFLVLVGSILVLFGLSLLIVKPLFYRMASKPFEYLKNKVKEKPNKPIGKISTILKTEVLLKLRDPDALFTNIALMVSMPIVIFFLNKIFGAMSTRLIGNNLALCFNVLIINLIALSSNVYASYVYSKDGKSSYLIKIQPTNYEPLLFGKLVINTCFMLLSFIATLLVLIFMSNIDSAKAILIILGSLFLYFAHLFYSAELDVMNPRPDLYQTISENVNNPNEVKATFMAFLASFVAFGILLFLLLKDATVVDVLSPFIKVMCFGLVMMIYRFYLFANKIKLYYKENEP